MACASYFLPSSQPNSIVFPFASMICTPRTLNKPKRTRTVPNFSVHIFYAEGNVKSRLQMHWNEAEK